MTRDARRSVEKVLALPDLLRILVAPRAAGQRVIFTNGCYDLLQSGHLRLLESAAEEGEILVVGLNGDDSVRRLKGPQRPILPYVERARLIAALEVVDFVTRFDEDTPSEIVRELAPDVLVKGGDWPLDRIVGRESVESRGGRVVRVPLVDDLSTSDLVERIRRSAGGFAET